MSFDFKYAANEGFDVLAARGGFKLALILSSVDTVLTNDLDGPRDAYGLALYKASTLGQYYRVGVFKLRHIMRLSARDPTLLY